MLLDWSEVNGVILCVITYVMCILYILMDVQWWNDKKYYSVTGF